MGVGGEVREGKGLSAERERGMGVKVQDSTVEWAAIGLSKEVKLGLWASNSQTLWAMLQDGKMITSGTWFLP